MVLNDCKNAERLLGGVYTPFYNLVGENTNIVMCSNPYDDDNYDDDDDLDNYNDNENYDNNDSYYLTTNHLSTTIIYHIAPLQS